MGCETIPWCGAEDNINYAMYSPGYQNDMVTLQQEQPKFYQYLQDGGFSVSWSSRRTCSVASDQALEQTINRERKSHGGVIGFTLRKGALSCWMATRYITAQYTETVEEMGQYSTQSTYTNHAEHSKTRIAMDDQDVINVVEYVARSSRLEVWRERLEPLDTSVHLNISADEHLPAGAANPWTTWKALNRLLTKVGRSVKSEHVEVGFSNEQETCDCGTRQTMQHLLVCPMMDTGCSPQALTTANDIAIGCARHWEGTV